MNSKAKFLMAVLFGVMSVVWIILLKTVDVQAVGPEGTSVGLASLNTGVQNALGTTVVNETWYKITTLLGYGSLAVAAAFGCLGLFQLIKNKSFAKVDKEIWALGGLYVVVLGLYAAFEVIVINYRPIILPDETAPEASFPSSHTMLACVIMLSTIIVINRFISNNALCLVIRLLCVAVLIVSVVGRLLSGAHWFTDIVGGILISLTVVMLFAGVIDVIKEKEKR